MGIPPTLALVPTVAVIPVKSFRFGKQRLSAALDEQRREMLGRALAERTASTAEQAGLIPLIVTADSDVAVWATDTGFPSLSDPGEGLDAAARTGTAWAQAGDSRWVVLHSDLPLIVTSDLDALASLSERGESFLAPSADGGTSAIGSTGDFDFSFGPGSFNRHLARLGDTKVVFRIGLAHDVDEPNDLWTALSTPRGAWMRDLLE